MSKGLRSFIAVWLVTTLLVFSATVLEYAAAHRNSGGFMVFAEIIAITSAVTGLLVTFVTARSFREGTSADLLLMILCLAITPIVMPGLLHLNQTDLTPSALAFVGYLFYALVFELTAVGLITALLIRKIRGSRRFGPEGCVQ